MADFDAFLESLMCPKQPPKFPLSMYYSEGVKHFQLKQLDLALHRLNSALELNPKNLKSLLKRCRCFISRREYENAKRDAEEVLRNIPRCTEAIDLKGKSQYLMGDFEGGHLTYQRGLKLAPLNDVMRIGQQICEEAIDNSMQQKTGIRVDKFDVMNLKEIRDRKFNPGKRDKIPALKDFSTDKKFMKELLADPEVKDLHGICEDTLVLISDSQRFCAMQMPLSKKSKSEKISKYKKVISVQYIVELLSRCRLFLKRGLTKSCILEGRRMIEIINICFGLPLSHKAKLKADVFHLLSLAYQQDKNNFLAHQYLQEELDISRKHGYLVGEVRAYHHLSEYYQKYSNFTKSYHYFSILNEKLKSEHLKMLLEKRDVTKSDCGIESINDKDCSDIERAKKWARDIEIKFKTYIRDNIIEPATCITKEKNSERIHSLNFGRSSIVRILSDSEGTEKYFTLEEETDSISSAESD